MSTAWVLAIAITAAPQTPAPQVDRTTISGGATFTYNGVKGFILRSAEKMPADKFGFQPTPDVRSFGQILAHISDANYLLCSPALGETSPNGPDIQKIETAKLDRDPLIAKLKESFAYCDRAYATLSDANAADIVPFMGSKRPRIGSGCCGFTSATPSSTTETWSRTCV